MDNTARLGLFKILSESSVASGVRRIEGVTAMGVLDLLSVQMATLRDSARAMKVINPMELPLHAQQMMAQLKEKVARCADPASTFTRPPRSPPPRPPGPPPPAGRRSRRTLRPTSRPWPTTRRRPWPGRWMSM